MAAHGGNRGFTLFTLSGGDCIEVSSLSDSLGHSQVSTEQAGKMNFHYLL